MGTVTAIGGYEPRRWPHNWPYTTTSTNAVSWSWQPSVSFDDWQTAVDFAARLAPNVGQVKVRKVGVEWLVSWNATQSTPTHPYTPYPYQQPWVTWGGGMQA